MLQFYCNAFVEALTNIVAKRRHRVVRNDAKAPDVQAA